MKTNSVQSQRPRVVSYGVGLLLGLTVLTVPSSSALAHVGHDNEFKGGNAAQIMQPLKVNPEAATAMGIQVEPIAVSADGATLAIPSSSLVEAEGQTLVYVKQGADYQPIVVQTGPLGGDTVEVLEGKLAPGTLLVTQGASLLYSQALRGGTVAATSASKTPAVSPEMATSTAGPSPLLWLGIIGGTGLVGAMIWSGSKKSHRSARNK